jgi:VWFA-related protein
VLVPVTVMDESNRIITGLEQENFQLYENKQAQPIKHFWKEDTPVSVGIPLDVSDSIDTKIERARDAVVAMVTASNAQNEFFLMTFADRPAFVQDFSPNVDDIRGQLLFTKPKGCTSLIDAIVTAISHRSNAPLPKEGASNHLRRRRQSKPLYRKRAQAIINRCINNVSILRERHTLCREVGRKKGVTPSNAG